MKPLVSIIIPTWNEEKNLPPCLSAVFSQRCDFSFEVIIVDSGSTDRTKEIAREFAKHHPIRLLEVKPGEFSHGRTRQYASERAEGEYLVYLVADAVPANDQWLNKLVESAKKDDRIAGVYSRQIPPPNADLIAKIRLKKRKAFSQKRTETELKSLEDYWLMTPLDRIDFCDFDDVSSLRKKSVLNQIPLPDCQWAEDLLWSKECLLKGYKIVYEPGSMVYHSHQSKAFYFFQRGWLDQKAANEFFGQIYYPTLRNALWGFWFSVREMSGEIFSEPAKFQEKIFALFQTPFICALEVAGRYLAGLKLEEQAEYDLWKNFSKARIFPSEARARVAKTCFTIGDEWRRVILAHPLAIINYMLTLSQNCELKFGIGIKPEAFPLRTAPIDFMITINQEPIFRKRLEMVPENLLGWKEFTLDLNSWAGKKVKLSLVTASEQLNSAWAGWAEPKIIFNDKNPSFRWKNFLIQNAEQIVSRNRFRHP